MLLSCLNEYLQKMLSLEQQIRNLMVSWNAYMLV